MTDAAWGTLSNQAVAAAAVVYFLALLAYVVEWASLRQVDRSRVLAGAGGPDVTGQPTRPRPRSSGTATGSPCSAGSDSCSPASPSPSTSSPCSAGG